MLPARAARPAWLWCAHHGCTVGRACLQACACLPLRPSAPPGGPSPAPQVDAHYDKLRNIGEYIEDTEEYINIELDAGAGWWCVRACVSVCACQCVCARAHVGWGSAGPSVLRSCRCRLKGDHRSHRYMSLMPRQLCHRPCCRQEPADPARHRAHRRLVRHCALQPAGGWVGGAGQRPVKRMGACTCVACCGAGSAPCRT